MSTHVEPMGRKTEVHDGANLPEIKFENLFPQIFKRGGEVRAPKGLLRMKDKPKALLKKAKELRGMYELIQNDNPELRVITAGGGVFMNGDTLTEFMKLEDDGFDDLVFAGWQVFIS